MRYEPKWDGFRCIMFRDGDEVELASRGGKTDDPLLPGGGRAGPGAAAARCVVDGELIVIRREPASSRLDFELLQQRIHPAASRVKLLAEQTPARLRRVRPARARRRGLIDQPYAQRRERLVEALAGVEPPVHVTPITDDVATARRWFEIFEGAGLDGLIAKPADIPYAPGKRLMYKVKHARTADCVVAGFRWHKTGAGASARCCSACTTTTASCTTSGCRRAFTAERRERAARRAGALPGERARRTTRGATGSGDARRTGSGCRAR